MNYKEAMEYLEHTSRFGMNLGLKRIERLLELMGNPEKGLKCIHVAGTNGKGSVTSMISSIMMQTGMEVGVYISPYLQRFTERISINGREIPEEDVARIITGLEPLIEKVFIEHLEHPTQFEIITAMMFKYFNENSVDIAVIEVGLGGRFDATNVIKPLISVITTISYDHMDILGDTLAKIAYEKAGIIKHDGVVVSYPQEKEASEVIRSACTERNAKLFEVSKSGVNLKEYSAESQIFDLSFSDKVFKSLRMKLLGEYQLLNAKTAITAVKALSIHSIQVEDDAIYSGLENTRWPGRLEVMSKNPLILLDGAHNLQGMKGLKRAIKKYFPNKKLILVVGILKDKQVEEMCDIIMPLADFIITTTPDSPRALSAEELKNIALKYCSSAEACDSIDEAYNRGHGLAERDDMLLFCGSLYMIGHIRNRIENN